MVFLAIPNGIQSLDPWLQQNSLMCSYVFLHLCVMYVCMYRGCQRITHESTSVTLPGTLIRVQVHWSHVPFSDSIDAACALNLSTWDFPGGTVVKNLPAVAGDTGSIPGRGRSHMPRSN